MILGMLDDDDDHMDLDGSGFHSTVRNSSMQSDAPPLFDTEVGLMDFDNVGAYNRCLCSPL